MVTKKHCDFCDKEVIDSFPCYAGFGYGSGLDEEQIECCSDECFRSEYKKRCELYKVFDGERNG